MNASTYPLAPWAECPDERTAGVVLLEADEDTKVTADRVGDCWRIVDWELTELYGELYWFERSWHTVRNEHIAKLLSGANA